jgi:hypothetical protein
MRLLNDVMVTWRRRPGWFWYCQISWSSAKSCRSPIHKFAESRSSQYSKKALLDTDFSRLHNVGNARPIDDPMPREYNQLRPMAATNLPKATDQTEHEPCRGQQGRCVLRGQDTGGSSTDHHRVITVKFIDSMTQMTTCLSKLNCTLCVWKIINTSKLQMSNLVACKIYNENMQ